MVGETPLADVRQGRTGVISHMGPGYPAEYVAIPLGPGHRVRICGPKACLVVVSTDAGPNRQSLLAGRIADVSVELFRKLCCDPSLPCRCGRPWSEHDVHYPSATTAEQDAEALR